LGDVRVVKVKLLWVTAAVIIAVIAATGTWILWPRSTVVPYVTPSWGSISVLGFTGGQKSGIVAVYIAKPSQNYAENWDAVATTENYYLKQTDSGQTGNIPYETNFVFLIEVIADKDNIAYLTLDNLKVELAVTGSFTKVAENTDGGDGEEFQFSVTGTQIGVNAVWDNNGNYFKLPASGSLNYTTKLWLWG
jgi:hypothetical protein